MLLRQRLSEAAINRFIKWSSVSLVVAILGYGAYFYVDRYRPQLFTGEQQSIVSARQAVAQEPGNVAARFRLATLYIDNNMLDEAMAETEEVLKVYPNHSRALTIQGVAYLRKGDQDSALEQFERVIELHSKVKFGAFSQDLNNSTFFAGAILLEKGEYAKAAEDFRRALIFDNADADAHAGLGRALYEQGQYEEALAELTLASSFLPDEAEYHYYRALALEKTGNIEGAEEELELALKCRDGYTEASEALKRIRGD